MTNPTSAPPPLAPHELVSVAGERELLETFLDTYRATVVRKTAGLQDSQAHRRLVPSKTTLASLLAHLTEVESSWFQRRLAQRQLAAITPGWRGDEGWDLAPDTPLAELVERYEAACAESRRVAAGLALDHTVPHHRLGRVSLRWVYVHMIEETARHAGHADILREQTDGATGFDG
jgi:uncharacterized protein DUF664